MHYICDINVVSMFTCSRHDPILVMQMNSSTPKVIHKGAGLGCLAWGSLPNPWRRPQQANLISNRVGCALFLAAAQRSMGNWKWSRRRWCLLGDVSIRMQVLGSTAAPPVSHTPAELSLRQFPITVLEWPWLSSAQVPVLPDTHARGRNREQPCAAFGEWVEEEEGNSCPTLTPMNQICVQILFFHLHGTETD